MTMSCFTACECLKPVISQVPKSDVATKGKFEATFEVEGPSPAELLERPVMGDGKILMSSAQLKRINSLLDSPVGC